MTGYVYKLENGPKWPMTYFLADNEVEDKTQSVLLNLNIFCLKPIHSLFDIQIALHCDCIAIIATTKLPMDIIIFFISARCTDLYKADTCKALT